ncbi:unnamed protein product [Adineta steineri]|uniref:S-adenosyl-L-methionine-dependent methyltransferase n=1 Tax=Adineta steineri TaxID=433720 RepID=A0A819LF23_9BILA|nr:unnamed protein product [Adineta steineri]
MNKDTVGLTSKTSAAARAHESKRPDRLFLDPLASIYSSQDADEVDASNGEETSSAQRTRFRTKFANVVLRSSSLLNLGTGWLTGMYMRKIYLDIAVRTRFLDDIVQKNMTNVKQIVLLACGGDFRPYRLPSLHTLAPSSCPTFYLLDVPHVLKYRQKCFTQLDMPATTPCSVVEIPGNLSNENWSRMLRETGFDVYQPTLWLAEGFLHYLTEQQIALLFNRIRQLSLSKQTCIAFDLVSSRFQSTMRRAVAHDIFQFALDDENDVHRIFSGLGCYDIECTSFQELGTMYGRKISRDRSFVVEAKMHPANT